MKTIIRNYGLVLITAIVALSACKKTDLLSNPNAASETSTIPVSLLLNHMTYSIYIGGGVIDGRPGSVNEIPWDQEMIWNQYFVSNYQYYRGANAYNWSYSATTYDQIKYATKLEEQSIKQFGSKNNVYYALAKFFRAYAFVWLTQRVGDIPASEAGNPNNITPKFDPQKEVYRRSLALLDTANAIFGGLISQVNAGKILDASGDIFGLTYSQWQKVINTYKLRVLISLSKRADDNADLNIKQQFATIINDPVTYPIMTSNADNMAFRYNAAYNQYPIYSRGNAPYNNYANMAKTFLDITTATKDPRTFIAATPAPALISGGKSVSDFSAYVGADINLDLGTLNTNSNQGKYSYANYNRYYSSAAGANAEPYIVIGYPELAFNIAEGINRGWASGDASAWYYKGINASLSWFGLSQGQVFTVGDLTGKPIGNTVIDINGFLSNPAVAYAGNNSTGLNQILTQKYVAFFNNSGWEAYYNWRRTGVPAFAQGGAGIGTPNNMIPRRWQYAQDELTYNAANATQAIASQFGGTDDVMKDTWLTK